MPSSLEPTPPVTGRETAASPSTTSRSSGANFVNATTGLGPFSGTTLGQAPPGTTFILANQIPSGVAGLPSYASAIGTVPPIGRTIGEISVSPPPPGTIVSPCAPPSSHRRESPVFWRIGENSTWTALAAQAPGWQYQAFTLQWYGRSFDGITTPHPQRHLHLCLSARGDGQR